MASGNWKHTSTPVRNGVPLFVILGNIGSGKSTLVDEICKHIQARCCGIQEPVAQWRSCGILQQFYENMKKYALSFQLFALASRSKLYKGHNWQNYDLCFSDGHIVTDRCVFSKNLLQHGILNQMELTWYTEVFNDWETVVPEMVPTRWIYLKTDPKTCKERITKRGRLEENAISEEYLTGLHELFEELIQTLNVNNTVKVLDANKEESLVLADLMAYVEHTCK